MARSKKPLFGLIPSLGLTVLHNKLEFVFSLPTFNQDAEANTWSWYDKDQEQVQGKINRAATAWT